MVSKGWIKKLFEETKQWVNDGLVTSDQQAKIINRYSGRMEYKRLINTITTLGSILIGLGIILFVASNWDKIGRPAKISLIFAVITLFHLASYYFRYIKKEYVGLAEGFTLIGAFSYGAGIWLIAQIYQIHYNFSAGILFWIFGILPIAYIYCSWTVLSLSSILSFIWLASYQAYYPRREAYGFLLLLAPLVALSYAHKQRLSLFVIIVSCAQWLLHFWIIQFFDTRNYYFEKSILTLQLLLVAIYMVFGFILYGLGMGHAKDSRLAVFTFLYKFLGILFITLSSYSLTFSHHYHKYSQGACPFAITILIGILVILAVLISSRLYRLSQEKTDSKEIKILYYLLGAGLLSVFVSLNWPRATSLFFNIILVAETLGFMYLGFIKHSEGIFRLSIAVFFLNILSRYFDIFWKMLPRSLLFIVGGILLILGAIFAERKRREMEERMRGGEAL
jgi:uncharacterized membrane protein